MLMAAPLRISAAVCLASAVWIGGIAACSMADTPIAVGSAEKTRPPVDLRTAISDVAEKAIPAVVHIEVTMSQEVANPFKPFENDPFFQRFFGIPKMPPQLKQKVFGLGSGMMIHPQGTHSDKPPCPEGTTKQVNRPPNKLVKWVVGAIFI